MSIGSRIKRIRNYRNKTMKEVGIQLRIPERQADIRMSQYESGTRVPRKDIIESLSNILSVSEEAINLPDPETTHGIFNLFEFYHLYGLHPVKIEGKVYLTMDEPYMDKDFIERLNDWNNEYENFINGEITKEQYLEWMLQYPLYSKLLYNNKRDEWINKK